MVHFPYLFVFFRILAVPQKLLGFHTALTLYENVMFEANEFGWIFQWVFWVGGNSETNFFSQQVHDFFGGNSGWSWVVGLCRVI